jgi:trans-AT polyketide synthase/acyltransferase/oxidoreductase domain-containing protein
MPRHQAPEQKLPSIGEMVEACGTRTLSLGEWQRRVFEPRPECPHARDENLNGEHGTQNILSPMTQVVMFPGQGSQAKGMGEALFERFADMTAQADRVLGYSIKELCVGDPRGELGQTQFTQPALFIVNALTYRARLDGGAAPPAFVAGHSLGEYNALLAAGCFSFEDGVTLVKARGALMGRVSGGGMSAVIGLEPDRIQQVLQTSEAGRRLDIANFNSFEQTVIAGPKEDLDAVKPALEQAGARMVVALNVSAPFHSRYMREAQREFAAFLERFEFKPPSIPVISNVTGRPYEGAKVRATLADQIGNSVRWLDSMLFLLEEPEPAFEEVGPGQVLSKLLKQIQKRRSKG